MNKKLSAAKVVNYLIFPNPCLSFLCGYNKNRAAREIPAALIMSLIVSSEAQCMEITSWGMLLPG